MDWILLFFVCSFHFLYLRVHNFRSLYLHLLSLSILSLNRKQNNLLPRMIYSLI